MTVSVNSPKTPVTEGSGDMAVASLPNVCKMPGPPAPFVPTPLPNIGKSDNSPQGNSTSVTIEKKPVAIHGATFNSTGDVASQGTGGGLVSSNVQGPTSFVGPGSMDVKIEGKNVQLLGDQMTNNGGPSGSPVNAATMPGNVQPPGAPAVPLKTQLHQIAKKCNKQENKRAGIVKPAKPKGKQCTVLGTKKHTCCKKAVDDAKASGAMSNDVKAEEPFTKGPPAMPGAPYPGEIRPDVVLMSGTKAVDCFDFKFNCKKEPSMSSNQRKNYTAAFGTPTGSDPLLVEAEKMNISVRGEKGSVVLRDSIVTAFFCRQPYPLIASKFGEVFDRWFSRTPDAAKLWSIVGPNADEHKAVSAKSLGRWRSELSSERAKKHSMSSLNVWGPQEINADWMFSFSGSRELMAAESCVLEFRAPSSSVEESPDDHADFALQVANILSCDSGYASPALVWGVESQQSEFRANVSRWAFRHPGFDVPYNGATCYLLGEKIRGAYWLTFLGANALAALGGEVVLRKVLPPEVRVCAAGTGVMLRLSKYPEIGDVNRLDNLPIVRAVAKIMEPISHLDNTTLKNNFPSEDQRARWERRHLD